MEIRTFQASVQKASDIWALWDVCRQFSRSRGFHRFYYAHLPPLGAPDSGDLRFRTEGFAEEVVRGYFRTGIYRTSRNLRYVQVHPQPFYWDEVPFGPDDHSDPEILAILHDTEQANGLCIPVFGPNGRNGLASLALPPDQSRLVPETLYEMQWACQLGHLRYCALWVSELGPQPHLSPREREVLIWVARGKSNPSIAEILGISVHTVDAHLRRIYLKLGVFDRITAAVRGIGVGLIAEA